MGAARLAGPLASAQVTGGEGRLRALGGIEEPKITSGRRERSEQAGRAGSPAAWVPACRGSRTVHPTRRMPDREAASPGAAAANKGVAQAASGRPTCETAFWQRLRDLTLRIAANFCRERFKMPAPQPVHGDTEKQAAGRGSLEERILPLCNFISMETESKRKCKPPRCDLRGLYRILKSAAL